MTSDAPRTVLSVFEAINRGDIGTAVELTHDDVVIDFSRSISPYRGVYTGRDEVRRFWTGWLGTWERVTWEAEQLTEVSPGRVVLVNHLTARASGIEVDGRGGHLWEVENGKVRRMTLFQDVEEARRAAAA
jgi:ketosteroid isomerase-like protein